MGKLAKGAVAVYFGTAFSFLGASIALAVDAGVAPRDGGAADAVDARTPATPITTPPRPLQDLVPVGREPVWESLFDGKSLKGWVQKGGVAKYEVKDGAIVGQSVPNTKNSFLSTERIFGDFVLELEFKVDAKLNSGIQIRGQSRPDYQDGRVHGYQIEIDPDVARGRLWTGGLYDEGRRGWLADLGDNAAARHAYKADEWNRLRIEAMGDSIKTFVNDVPAVDAVDPVDLEGFIGLQVHGVGKREEPLFVSWRNLRVKDYGRRAWRPLVGNKALAGFRPVGGTWTVEGGVVTGSVPTTERGPALLFAETPLGDFTARAEVKLTGGNAGIYVAAVPAATPARARGLQIDLDAGARPRFGAGGLFEVGGRGWLEPNPIVIPSAPKAARPADGGAAVDAGIAADAGVASQAGIDPQRRRLDERQSKAASAWKPNQWTPIAFSSRGSVVETWIGGHRAASLRDLARDKNGLLAIEVAPGSRLELRNLAVLSETIPGPVPKFPIGWCIRAQGTAPDDARVAGFEYVELALQDVLDLPEPEFAKAVERFTTLGIPALTGYNFYPNDLALIGPKADRKREQAHLERALPRVAKLGVKHVIFASGASRRAPDGMAPAAAWKELVAASKRLARAAAKHKLGVLIMPLRSTDTNLVTKVEEGIKLVKDVGAPNFQLAIDYSFISIEKESPEVLRKAGKLLRHVQISNPNGRGYPMSDADADYRALFAVLDEIGYQGGFSVHARTDNFWADAPRALRFLRRHAEGLGQTAPNRASRP